MIIWHNGVLQSADHGCVAPADRGFTLGDGLFETLRVQEGRILRLDSHLRRLESGAAILHIELPQLDYPEIFAKTLEANGLVNAVLRLTVTRGISTRGILPAMTVRPTVMVTAAPPAPPLPPARCIVASVTRRNEYSPLCGVKSLNYLDNILARLEAGEKGVDEALLCNTQGHVAESTVANLFIVTKEGKIQTPPLQDGALPGTMREEIRTCVPVQEASLTVQQLRNAVEIFLSNSLGIRPVVELDGKRYDIGPVTEKLRTML